MNFAWRRIPVAVVRGSCPQRDIDNVLALWPAAFRLGVEMDAADVVIVVGDINRKLMPYVAQAIARRTVPPLTVWIDVRAQPIMRCSYADLAEALTIDLRIECAACTDADIASLAGRIQQRLAERRRDTALPSATLPPPDSVAP